MRVAVTGTPGTGKTTVTGLVKTDLDVVHLNEVIREEGLTEGTDEKRGSLVADLEALDSYFEGREDVLVESHLAHHVSADRVIVLRCHPETLAERLRQRGEPGATVEENAESEALGIVLSEAVERHGREPVYEIDATDRTPEETAREIERVLAGERDPSAGEVSFVEYL